MSIHIDFSLSDHSSPDGWSPFWTAFAQGFPRALCEAYIPQLLHAIGLSQPPHTTLVLDWALVDNATIQNLNTQYRHKNQATDVLSFPIYNHLKEALATNAPQLLLGQVVVSAEWAKTHCGSDERTAPFSNSLQAYVVDRFLHGTLHCLGQHHNTEIDYATVIHLQNVALKTLLAAPSSHVSIAP